MAMGGELEGFEVVESNIEGSALVGGGTVGSGTGGGIWFGSFCDNLEG